MKSIINYIMFWFSQIKLINNSYEYKIIKKKFEILVILYGYHKNNWKFFSFEHIPIFTTQRLLSTN